MGVHTLRTQGILSRVSGGAPERDARGTESDGIRKKVRILVHESGATGNSSLGTANSVSDRFGNRSLDDLAWL